MPEFPEQIEKRLVGDYGINAQQAHQIVRQSQDELFERLSEDKSMAPIAATTLLNTFSEMERDGVDATAIPDDCLVHSFELLKQGRFAKEALPAILKEMAGGTKPEDAIKKLGLEAVDEGEAFAIIEGIVKEREEFVRSKGMAAVGPLMGPVMGALKGKLDGKQVNKLLTEAIRKLLA